MNDAGGDGGFIGGVTVDHWEPKERPYLAAYAHGRKVRFNWQQRLWRDASLAAGSSPLRGWAFECKLLLHSESGQV